MKDEDTKSLCLRFITTVDRLQFLQGFLAHIAVFFYCLWGAKISQKEDFGSFGAACAGFLISILLFFGEFVFVIKMKWHLGCDMYLCLIPCAYFLLKAALASKIQIAGGGILRQYSSLIYFTHMFCAEICRILTPVENANSLVMFLIIFALTVLLDTAIIFAAKSKRLSFIKRFY